MLIGYSVVFSFPISAWAAPEGLTFNFETEETVLPICTESKLIQNNITKLSVYNTIRLTYQDKL